MLLEANAFTIFGKKAARDEEDIDHLCVTQYLSLRRVIWSMDEEVCPMEEIGFKNVYISSVRTAKTCETAHEMWDHDQCYPLNDNMMKQIIQLKPI